MSLNFFPKALRISQIVRISTVRISWTPLYHILEEVKEEPQKSPYGESSLSAELLSYSSPASLLSMTTYNANSGSERRNNVFSDEFVYQKIIEYKRNLVRDYSPLYSSLYPLNSLIITYSELLLERFLWDKAIKGLWRAYKNFQMKLLERLASKCVKLVVVKISTLF